MRRLGSRSPRRLGVALALWLGFAALSPALAEDDTQRFSIHPSLRVVGIADDNVHLTDTGQEGDVGVWVIPRVEMTYRTRVLELGADLGADVRRYTSEQTVDDEFFRLLGHAEVGILPGLSARVSNAYLPQPAMLGLPTDESVNLLQTDRAQTELRYHRELANGREIELGVQGTRFLSEDFPALVPTAGGGVPTTRFNPDYWEGAGYVELQGSLGRRSTSYLRGQFRARSFDESPLTDFHDFGVVAGVRSRWLDRARIQLGAGWGLVSYDGLSDTHRLLAEADIQYWIGRGWSARLSAANRFSADLAGNDFTETGARLDVERRIDERTAIELGAFASRLKNEAPTGGTDWFGGFQARATRQIARHVQAAVTYRYWKNGGDFDANDFRQNRLAFEMFFRR